MRHFLILILIMNTWIFGASEMSKEERIKKQIELEIEKEKKYSIEQKFYQGEQYDLSESEVNPDSIDSIPELEIQDFDMDSVYD